ncbi:MAG: tetratricopeptide repeat protein [Reichenbachiella sp.]
MKKVAVLFIFLSTQCLNIQADSKENLDSLNQLSKEYVCVDMHKFDSLSQFIISQAKSSDKYSPWAYALTLKAYGEICGGNMRKALLILSDARNLYDMADDPKGKSIALKHTVSCHANLSQMDSALIYSNQQIALAKGINDTLTLANAYLSRSGVHTRLAQNDSIIFYAVRGLKILGEVVHDALRGSFNIAIGNAYYQNEEYVQAVKYFSRASNFFNEESMDMGRIYHNLGSVFTRLQMYDSSFHYLDKTISINEKLNRKFFLAFNYQALAENYNESGNCKKSIEYNLMAMSMSEEVGEKRSYAGALVNITECYIKLGQLANAIKSSQKAVTITKEIGDAKTEANAYFLLSEAYDAAGKYELAFKAHKKFYSIDSMLLGLDKRSAIAEIETKYETEKKETEIASLSQQALIQSLEIQKINQMMLIGIIAIVLGSLGAYLFVRQKALKNKEARTEIEQRFLRSQLNPHFIFNALMAIQNFMLKNSAQEAALYLAKFSKLMREILENSREEFIPVESEIEMLTNYLEIHKLRADNSFDYKIDLDDNIDGEMDTIPPMFVQPFVENAIEHGIINAKGRGLIELKFSKENEHISIEVRDNGGGLSHEGIKTKEHNSLASTIIQERMDLFNKSLKEKIQLMLADIKNDHGEILGTKVELRVPFGYL